MNSSIEFDLTQWPIVAVTYHGVPTPEQHEQERQQWGEIWRRGERYASVIDFLKTDVNPQSEQDKAIHWVKANAATLKRLCPGSALVMSSPIVRASVRILFLLHPPPFPYSVVATREAGFAYARKVLAKSGAGAPPD